MRRLLGAGVTALTIGAMMVGCNSSSSSSKVKSTRTSTASIVTARLPGLPGDDAINANGTTDWVWGVQAVLGGIGTTGTTTGGTTGGTTVAPTPPTNQGSRFWYVDNTFGNPYKTHTAAEDQLSRAVVQLMNAERARNGLQPLVVDADALRAGKAHVEDMAGRNYFNHVSPEGWQPQDRLALTGARGPITALGENIAAGQPSAQAIMDTWMASPGHRANILGQFTSVGVGIAPAQGVTVSCAVFLSR